MKTVEKLTKCPKCGKKFYAYGETFCPFCDSKLKNVALIRIWNGDLIKEIFNCCLR